MYWNFDTVACEYPPPPTVYVDPWLPVYVPDIVDADLDLDDSISQFLALQISGLQISGVQGTEYRASWTSTPTFPPKARRWATLGHSTEGGSTWETTHPTVPHR